MYGGIFLRLVLLSVSAVLLTLQLGIYIAPFFYRKHCPPSLRFVLRYPTDWIGIDLVVCATLSRMIRGGNYASQLIARWECYLSPRDGHCIENTCSAYNMSYRNRSPHDSLTSPIISRQRFSFILILVPTIRKSAKAGRPLPFTDVACSPL